MSPSGRAGPVTGTNFALGSYDRKFQPRFRDEKRPNILATSSDAKCEKESKYGEKKKIMTFAPVIAWLYHCS